MTDVILEEGMTSTADALALERKLKMYEAREAIFGRIGSETFPVINLDSFLNATVSEFGKMMRVDRCDLITPTPEGALEITHEYRATEEVPSFLGLELPVTLPALKNQVDISNPQVVEDTSSPGLAPAIVKISERLGSKSLLVVPVLSNGEVLGLIGLHHCRQNYCWDDDEVNFINSLAQEIAIGYRYTHIYSEKEKEARVTRALLETANDINRGSDFSEVTARILDKAIELLRLEAACLAILDASNSDIHFTNLRTAGIGPEILKQPSLKLPVKEMLPKSLEHGQMLKILRPEQNEYTRIFLNEIFTAGAAIIAPIIIEDRIFGGLILLWSKPQSHFTPHDTALALGIADQLAITLSKARLSAEVLRLRRELEGAHMPQAGGGLVGKSGSLRRCLEMATYVADSLTTVLIEGESGTGKEMLADLIQSRSSRHDKPYVKVNCGAVPEALLESELFGHEPGAFTDARSRRIGKFEEASGGTLFLDEIGEMSQAAQVRLLRVLQSWEFTRVGGNEVIKTDVRVIAASDVDVEAAVREGQFRRDLFYRLNVYPIKLPALRERRDDIPLLALHFLEIYNKRANKDIGGITEKALARLRRYDWPGNVRELENAVERAVIVAQNQMIKVDDLPDTMRGAETEDDTRKTVEIEVGATIDEVERRIILETLAYTGGDKSRTAQILGIGRKTLYRKLQQYNLDVTE